MRRAEDDPRRKAWFEWMDAWIARVQGSAQERTEAQSAILRTVFEADPEITADGRHVVRRDTLGRLWALHIIK